jgi:hypothetical protein
MVDGTIQTGVDKLINLLNQEDKISIADAAKKIGILPKILQTWVDFLVEEKVINIEYKFTQPYIYLNRSEEDQKQAKTKFSIQTMKKEFFGRAKKKNFPENQIKPLWDRKLKNEIRKQKEYFYRYAKIKKLENLEELWEDFSNKIKKLAEI